MRRQNEAQEWNDMLSTTVESLKTQMSNGLKESVLRVRQLQGELESEQQLNERLAGDLEQLRRRTSSESQLSDAGEDVATGAASPVARAMERLRSQLGASRARVEELESENELLMEKLVEFESRTAPADTDAAAAVPTEPDESAAIEQPVEQSRSADRGGNDDASESDSNAAMNGSASGCNGVLSERRTDGQHHSDTTRTRRRTTMRVTRLTNKRFV
jgi:chromosome segregation ATPase